MEVGAVQIAVPFLEPAEVQLAKEKVGAAVRLVQAHSPKHHARIERFIPHVLVLGKRPYPAVYVAAQKMCHMLADWVLLPETSVERVASTLVHESCHGYLESLGIVYEEKLRQRIENVCFRTELAFARKAPGLEARAVELEAWLRHDGSYWAETAFHQRRAAAMETNLQKLRETGAPKVIVFFLSWLTRKKRAQWAQSQSGVSSEAAEKGGD
jgi:hypothetical protein